MSFATSKIYQRIKCHYRDIYDIDRSRSSIRDEDEEERERELERLIDRSKNDPRKSIYQMSSKGLKIVGNYRGNYEDTRIGKELSDKYFRPPLLTIYASANIGDINTRVNEESVERWTLCDNPIIR